MILPAFVQPSEKSSMLFSSSLTSPRDFLVAPRNPPCRPDSRPQGAARLCESFVTLYAFQRKRYGPAQKTLASKAKKTQIRRYKGFIRPPGSGGMVRKARRAPEETTRP